MKCKRCGRTEAIEKHHVKERQNGGTNELTNIEEYCSACHDYEHARRNIVATIKSMQNKLMTAHKVSRCESIRLRLELLQYRKAVLESLNSPPQIKQTGKYISYWIDKRTHHVIPITREDEHDEHVEQAIQVKLL